MAFKLNKYFTVEDYRLIGVYFLIGKGKIVYIGKSTSLLNRLASHVSIKFDKIRFIQCDELRLDEYERRWIMRFRPKGNFRHLFVSCGKRHSRRKPVNMEKSRPQLKKIKDYQGCQ